jgi:hypothetical protein
MFMASNALLAGDGAGVGKGRQISGIILDNYARGRRKSVWISTSTDLYADAVRDLRDLGSHIQARATGMGWWDLGDGGIKL